MTEYDAEFQKQAGFVGASPNMIDHDKDPFADKLIFSERMLVAHAKSVAQKAYCPYSKFKVGAALMVGQATEPYHERMYDDSIYSGCNVENASYGLTNCAERTAIFKMVSQTHLKKPAIRAIVIYTPTPTPSAPCGACRQVINEFADQHTIVISVCDGPDILKKTLSELLPHAFGPHNLEPANTQEKAKETPEDTEEEELPDSELCNLCHHPGKGHEPFTGCTKTGCQCQTYQKSYPLCFRCDHDFYDHAKDHCCHDSSDRDCLCQGYVPPPDPCGQKLDRCPYCLGHIPNHTPLRNCTFHTKCIGAQCGPLCKCGEQKPHDMPLCTDCWYQSATPTHPRPKETT